MEWTVVKFAVQTRVVALVLQTILNVVIPDHVADAFSPPRAEEPLLLDNAIELLFGGLSHWDAEHFLFIAEHGYLYEHNFAFFPLFPFILKLIASILLWPLNGYLTVRGCLLLSVAFGNTVLFLLSAYSLYRLSCLVLQDRRMAFISSLLYCVTPANVFMVAGYSESLFAALTFGGLWLLESGFTLRASLVLCLATAARANGLVNAGFLLYLPLRRCIAQGRLHSKGFGLCHHVWMAVRFLLTSLMCIVVVAIPFGIFQYYGYQTFCNPSLTQEQISPALLSLAMGKSYRVPDKSAETPIWCHRPIPLLYSYIQDVYWDVGFLRYFQIKQIPNFLLALPIAALGCMATCMYAIVNPTICVCLGLWDQKTKEDAEKSPAGFFNQRVFVYVVHASVLLLFGIFCMHVQVLTRFLASSSPVVYWISAHLLLLYEPLLSQEQTVSLTQGQQEFVSDQSSLGVSWTVKNHNPILQLMLQWRTCSRPTHCILGYFALYWILGLALHCNSLPWT